MTLGLVKCGKNERQTFFLKLNVDFCFLIKCALSEKKDFNSYRGSVAEKAS